MIRWQGRRLLTRELVRMERLLQPRFIIEMTAQRMEREARERVPRRSGRLKRSIHRYARVGYVQVVEAPEPYAGFVEYGTRPHMIFPRRARVLRFVVKGPPRRVVYATKVFHPGTRPQPYWRPAFKKSIEWLSKYVKSILA